MVAIVLDHCECLSRGNRLNPHGIRPSEISDVVRDNVRATGRRRQLQNEIVVRIGEEWSPCVKNLLMPGKSAENIDNSFDLRGAKSGNEPRTQSNGLILNGKSNRDRNFQIPGADCPQYLVARATTGTKS